MENKKRTYQMFLGQIEDRIPEIEEIVRLKFENKIKKHYTDIGKTPGILIEENKRRKLLRDLGVEEKIQEVKMLQQDQIKQVEPQIEEVKGQMPDLTNVSSKAIQSIEREKNDVLNMIPAKYRVSSTDQKASTSTALSLVNAMQNNQSAIALRQRKIVQPQWHAPWKLMRVISGHMGWVRSIAMDPMNRFFVTGSNDRTIKFWDLVEGKLKITLTGHINTVRGLVVSDRHPYLFSCGEDKKVLCWDLEQNKVVRHYHGHLSGVYSIALHPELDILVTGGRDSTARMWDMRTKAQIHCLGGHGNTVEDILCQADEPQIITGSHDKTVRLWDIRTGSSLKTLTNHKKGIRALAMHHEEYTFASAASDKIRIWKLPEGEQLRTIPEHNAVINALAVNKDNVLVSGGDNGTLYFFDWKSGHNFQQIKTQVQPGSLSCEAGIYDIKFDKSSLRMITAECDKTIKIYKEDEEATPETHPIEFDPKDF
eukprot:403348282